MDMKESRLVSAMQYLDEDLIAQAESYVSLQKKWYQSNWVRWGTIAASIVLILSASLGLFCRWQNIDIILFEYVVFDDLVWVETSLKDDENDLQQMHGVMDIPTMGEPDSSKDNNTGNKKPGYATQTMLGAKAETKKEEIVYLLVAVTILCVFIGGNILYEKQTKDNISREL